MKPKLCNRLKQLNKVLRLRRRQLGQVRATVTVMEEK